MGDAARMATNPVVGRHLATRVTTGSVCCYRSA